jgi:hypothetical protein
LASNFDIKYDTTKSSWCGWNYAKNEEYDVMPKAPKTWGPNVSNNKEHITRVLASIKSSLWRSGILSYNDCYSFAMSYLIEVPKLKRILCNRFPLVFIDETQDLQVHQLEIIDTIFFNANACLQRVGDINQSIFHQGSEGNDCPWILRDKCLTFNKSFRLTEEVGHVVSSFARKLPNATFSICGNRILARKIQPYILVYDYEHRKELLDKYVELIRFWNLTSEPESKMYGFHVIGWNVKWSDRSIKDNKKLRLCDLYKEYNSTNGQPKTTYDTLSEFIDSAKGIRDSFLLKKLIVSIICEAFRQAEYNTSRIVNGREYKGLYTSELLSKLILSQDESFIDRYNLLCYQCIKSLYCFDSDKANKNIQTLIYMLFEHFEINKEPIVNFITSTVANNNVSETLYDPNAIELSFENVHKVKGQTHCSTLYIETFFQKKYESQHLIKDKRTDNPFYGLNDNLPRGTYVSSALKVLYVGMSRPTHLLCYAMHKSSFQLYDVNRLRDMGWIVEDITEGK